MQTHVTEILEYINIAITLLFLFFYIYRLIHLRHFAVTERYRSNSHHHMQVNIPRLGSFFVGFMFCSVFPFSFSPSITGFMRARLTNFGILKRELVS